MLQSVSGKWVVQYLHFVAAVYWEQEMWRCTFDRAWSGRLYGAEHPSARGKARSARWRTWWSRSTAHSLWAWSLTSRGNNVNKNKIVSVDNFCSAQPVLWNASGTTYFLIKKCMASKPAHTWPPDAFGRRWDTTVKTLMPFPKKPVDDFPFLIHHKPLHLIHIRTPVVSL